VKVHWWTHIAADLVSVLVGCTLSLAAYAVAKEARKRSGKRWVGLAVGVVTFTLASLISWPTDRMVKRLSCEAAVDVEACIAGEDISRWDSDGPLPRISEGGRQLKTPSGLSLVRF
jgi:hypothetical protein